MVRERRFGNGQGRGKEKKRKEEKKPEGSINNQSIILPQCLEEAPANAR